MEEEVETYVPPKCVKRVYETKDQNLWEDEDLPSITLIHTRNYTNITKITEHDHLMDDNWHEWKERMRQVFYNCDINEYVTGEIKCSNEAINPIGALNWDKNDSWAQQIIRHYVTSSQMNHVRSKSSAEEMFSALSVTHDNKAHQTMNHIQCQLYETKLLNSDDLLKHLDTLKSYHDHINRFPNAEFHVSDMCFKAIILVFLPSLWHTYVEPYNGNANDPNDPDPKWHLPCDTFIGLLQEEYKIQLTRSNNGTNRNSTNGSMNLVKTQNATSTSKSLAD